MANDKVRMNALWWWIDRWRKSSAYMDMTLEQQGAYRNLLDEANLRGGPLPNDERVLAKACGDVKAWRRLRPVVMARFVLAADGWRNETLDQVLKESRRRATNQANYRSRRDNKPDNKQGNKRDNKPDSPSPSPSPSLSPSETKIAAPPNVSVSDEIQEKAGKFLERYPEIYAEERRGAHFQLKPVLHFMTACELVQGWPDLKRLELMFRTFCQLPSSEKMAWPGTPAQFLHLAPEIDVRLRQAGA